jgi:hypothetical protein
MAEDRNVLGEELETCSIRPTRSCVRPQRLAARGGAPLCRGPRTGAQGDTSCLATPCATEVRRPVEWRAHPAAPGARSLPARRIRLSTAARRTGDNRS